MEEFISIYEAAKRLKLAINQVMFLIDDRLLKVYRNNRSAIVIRAILGDDSGPVPSEWVEVKPPFLWTQTEVRSGAIRRPTAIDDIRLRGNDVASLKSGGHTAIGGQFNDPYPKESDHELCNRLRSEGCCNKEIAAELKRLFPSLSDAKIGKLVTAVPGKHVDHEAYRGRGRSLLGKKK